MKKLLLIILLLPAAVFAQTKRVDSLKKILAKTPADTNRVNLLNDIGDGLILFDAGEGIKYAKQAMALSNKLGFKKGLAYAYLNRGQMYFNINASDSVTADYNVAIKLFKEVNDLSGLAYVYEQLGRYLRSQSNRAKAIEYFQMSANIYEKLKDDKGTSDCLILIANNYNTLRNFDKALESYKKALEIRMRIKNENAIAQTIGGIGITYRNMAGEKGYKLAIQNMMKARAMFLKIDHKLNIAIIDKEIGMTYEFMGRYKEALKYLHEALSWFQKVDFKRELGSVYKCMGSCYFNLKQYPKAKLYLEKGLAQSLAEKNEEHIVEAYEWLYDYYKEMRDDKMSLYYHEKWMAEKDSMINRTNFDKLSELTTKFETEKKEQEIKLLSKENTIQKLSIAKHQTMIGIIAAILIVGLLFGGLLYNRNKHKQKSILQQQKITQQEELTKAIIDAEEKERKRIASDLHDGVGQMFSAVKMNLNGLIDRISFNRVEDRFLAEKTLALVDESCKEVRVISHQMMPNMLLRSGIASDVKSFIEKIDSERLKVNVEATGFKNKLESNVEIVLYRVIQETVNNVIKHAQATELNITLKRDDTGITANIADNGIGFNVDFKDEVAGIGLKNIAARIEYLKGTVNYKSSPGKGTTVNIWVPVS